MSAARVCCLMVLAWLAGSGLAQPTASPLVGAWHNMDAPPIPQTMLIFSADGYYAQVAIPPGRSKAKSDFDHRTREELMKQFGGVRASYGTWRTEGTRLIQVRTASEEPAREGTQAVAEFRIEGDVLIVKGAQHEARFRRMK